MTEEDKAPKKSRVGSKVQKKFFNKPNLNKPKILFAICVMFIATLIVGFQNCAREHIIGFSSSNPCVASDVAEGENNRCTETFIPGVSAVKTDILFIVDNSGSMREEQEKISEKFDSFLATVRNIDFQIGIITTDSTNANAGDRGKLLDFTSGIRYLTPNTSNLESLFKSKVKTGTKGSGDEYPFLCAKKAIEQRDAHNQGFFRDGALFNLVIVTDEDGNNGSKNSFIDRFEEIWPNKTFTVNGITGPCKDAYSANVILESIRNTGGIEGDICANDYGKLLSDIGHSISSSISLTFPPAVETMKVTLENGTELGPRDYTVNKSKIVIQRNLAPGTKVTFDYEYQF